MQEKGLILVGPNEIHCFIGAKSGFGEFLLLIGGENTGENAFAIARLQVRFQSIANEKVVVIAEALKIGRISVELPVLILDAAPVYKSMLGGDFAAQVPLTHVAADILGRNHFCDGLCVRMQWRVVGNATMRMRIQASQHTRTRGRANRLRNISAVENKTALREPVKVGRSEPVVAITFQGVAALLIRP
ncbi:MAG: hypothetical protein A2268_06385 [Candidatus Raymondbacteria bacterium RifOxyA12_full_50_37]|uniref:Uncharacterized protein n=1 Tax=Candidatus Raymondbacteria bacterium RIFOXYD12_FULL_49_13 TaxID=1817890 RepID=A0A1F7FEJ7_UNCRA|nr:MAG: hypothetical protein A2350_21705 [Candidatus Raymondbacteria bacterium RifOxyB12_full_50_8]OGJ92155.1 MAG: hypothetical protein A2268_06385 [Candidatus Raymondbacteria bacterium RifOxyA12_full_50_37]OGJ94439.1 MAG: hypothetical protein A2248_15315 [Candidatus Raymondbacteria bacterium RIFOXYA2_FULL_49_16]OGJ99195.1 MAG: hypothetical protein A2453_07165 [Candidatus Raymondbacteria bacterium RIFOXYC2_FULL_50_21]OGK05119.1 MAG: hypothetical protein A2519_13405 [Candidatus Raymondbacteria b